MRAVVRSTVVRFALLFVALIALTLPFPYHIVPSPGELLAPATESLARFVGDRVLGLTGHYTAAVASDTTGMYIHFATCGVLAALLAAAWVALRRTPADDDRARAWLGTIALWYLALQLAVYGCDKLFKTQFYLPEPNTLYTPLGFLHRDILYWSTIGSSSIYCVATGAVEVLAVLLLFARRTRPLGALIALAAMAQVMLVNIGFDISVKLSAAFLLGLAIIAAAPALRSMFDLFLRRRTVAPPPLGRTFGSERRLTGYAIAKAAVICLIAAEALYPAVTTGILDDDRAPRPPLHGAYEVTSCVRNGRDVVPAAGSPVDIRRFFIHRRGFFIVETMDDRMRDGALVVDTTAHTLVLSERNGRSSLLAWSLSGHDSTLTLAGYLGPDSVVLSAHRLDLDALPLFGKSFHWTIDEVDIRE